MKKILIKDVLPDSIAEEMEIEAGDYLLSINETEIKDILDYKYQIFDEDIIVCIEKADGEVWDIEIEKEENEEYHNHSKDKKTIIEEEPIEKLSSISKDRLILGNCNV